MSSQMPISPGTVDYFYGRIAREEAEQYLNNEGCKEGLYLLRESMTTAGNYVLSICHQGRIHHYSIERQSDGKVMIQEGKKFLGPVELVKHHSNNLDGFLTKPLYPCKRKDGQEPMAWPGVTMQEMDRIIQEKASEKKLEGRNLVLALGAHRQQFVNTIAKELHKEQPWFHGNTSRDEADKIMVQSGHKDGKFLVRERGDGSFALSLSFRNQTKHYKIEKQKVNHVDKLAIEDGPKFDNLMDMIANYYNRTDGLLCKLTTVCVHNGFKKKPRNSLPGLTVEKNVAYGQFGQNQVETNGPDPGASDRPLPPRPRVRVPQPNHSDRSRGAILPDHMVSNTWDEPDIPDEPPPLPDTPRPSADDPQKIYDCVPRTEDVFNLNSRDLELQEKLGAGNFGSVMKGVFKRGNQKIPVAVKTLKQDELPNAQAEIMKEAKVMAGLQHRNIVRLIGVVRSDTIMLVMELAPLGQLNKYLKNHKDMPITTILELCFQVAEGMAYLESKNFVHRDLAARNVLLVSECFAKISDFGMSKALGLGGAYYQAESAGKWPLKWYAPECIYFFKFDSKSDVWSFGVTLWEAFSYGARPYRGLKGQEILRILEAGKRLERPDHCPIQVYKVMQSCWLDSKTDRPTFKEIVELLRDVKKTMN